MDIDSYTERLYLAFSSAARPALREITPHRCGECDEVAARLLPHEAQDVPEEDMFWLGDSLPLLGPKSFRYYLPRFIEFCLRTPSSSLDGVIDYNLAPSSTLDIGERNRFSDFTQSEREVVLEFVRYRAGLQGADFDRQYFDKAEFFWNSGHN